jgi:hypothetical protein
MEFLMKPDPSARFRWLSVYAISVFAFLYLPSI